MAKITFSPITIEELKPLITLAFQGDEDLLTKYSLLKTETHIPTLEESVDKNYQTIIEAMSDPVYAGDVSLYKVILRENGAKTTIGFTVIIENEQPPHMLFSFGINIRYRGVKNSTSWLQATKECFGKYISVALHKNNQQAIGFFEKNGFTKKINEVYTDYVTLTSNWRDLIKIRSKSAVQAE